jgi:hypothetical protein
MDKSLPVASGEIGADLLLAGSDAFRHLADELAVAHRHWQTGGADEALLQWSVELAEMAGWWSGRLEAEAHLIADINSSAAPRSSPRRCHGRMPPTA